MTRPRSRLGHVRTPSDRARCFLYLSPGPSTAAPPSPVSSPSSPPRRCVKDKNKNCTEKFLFVHRFLFIGRCGFARRFFAKFRTPSRIFFDFAVQCFLTRFTPLLPPLPLLFSIGSADANRRTPRRRRCARPRSQWRLPSWHPRSRHPRPPPPRPPPPLPRPPLPRSRRRLLRFPSTFQGSRAPRPSRANRGRQALSSGQSSARSNTDGPQL